MKYVYVVRRIGQPLARKVICDTYDDAVAWAYRAQYKLNGKRCDIQAWEEYNEFTRRHTNCQWEIMGFELVSFDQACHACGRKFGFDVDGEARDSCWYCTN